MADLERKLAATEGVTVHGWVGQDRLAREYQAADVLLYPAITPTGEFFPETSCISVMEAQAAGCFPITSDHGALRETNARGTQVSAETFEADAMRVLEAFWDRPLTKQNGRRAACRDWALRQTWTKVASDWLALIAPKELVEEAS